MRKIIMNVPINNNIKYPKVADVIKKAKRLERIVCFISVFFWLLLVSAVIIVINIYVVFIHPVFIHVLTELPGDETVPIGVKEFLGGDIANFLLASITICASLLGLAAVSTLVYIYVSRKTVLKQLQSQLQDISNQIREMQV